jgi:membrane protease YdiL (CAAX protease family)
VTLASEAKQAPEILGARVNRLPGKLWRFLQFPVTRAFLAVLSIAAVIAAVTGVRNALHLPERGGAAHALGLVLVAGICLVYAAYVRGIERRAVVELAPRDGLPAFGQGFGVGAALFSTTILVLWAAGVYTVAGVNGADAMLVPLLSSLIAAFLEELVVRGVLFRIIEESLGSWLALGITALLFGLLHAFNPGATVASTLAIALEAGVLLAAVYMYSRTLWMCIGLHCAWNFAEGGVFGASVSGGKAQGLLVGRFHGAEILTGGKFGPEASIAAVVVCVAAGVFFVQLARRRGHILPPFWRRA